MSALRIKQVPIADLQPAEYNPRRISKSQREALRRSLKEYGAVEPAVVNADGTIIGGHMRVAEAAELGWRSFPCVYVDLAPDKAKLLNLALNRISGEWDEARLGELLASLSDDGADLALSGFESAELERLIAGAGPQPDPEPIEPPAKPRTKPGDLYVLGEHRLLCGDSSVPDHLDRVFADTVGCVLTDPPYGIALETDYRSMGTGSAKAILKGTQPGKYRAVIGDDTEFDAAFLSDYFAAVDEQFWFGADYYRRTLSDSDRDGSWLVWDKRNEASDAGFGSGFELIWSRRRHKRDLLRHYFFGAFGAEGAGRVHLTQKPTPLLSEILERWALADCVVADPFLGSGSTLIACEKTGRVCFGLEIDPAYCDVIVDRWQRQTGKKAKRERR